MYLQVPLSKQASIILGNKDRKNHGSESPQSNENFRNMNLVNKYFNTEEHGQNRR